MQKYTKIQASVQHGLYLFTCEIHSFNSTLSIRIVGSNPSAVSHTCVMCCQAQLTHVWETANGFESIILIFRVPHSS